MLLLPIKIQAIYLPGFLFVKHIEWIWTLEILYFIFWWLAI